MAYPGLILANAALGEGIETHLFFTFWGFDMITRARMDDLKFTPLGNTAMRLVQAPNLPIPAMAGGLPGMTKVATKMMRKQIADLEIPTVPELLEQIVEMGAHLWACKMSFDMMQLNEADLFDGVGGGDQRHRLHGDLGGRSDHLHLMRPSRRTPGPPN
ncbi:MAG: DsrE/DsrF/DrsH-like family protein [Micropruina glycogenica]